MIGASMGGISALLAIHEWKARQPSPNAGHPELARALVLVDIATRMETNGAMRIMEFMRGGMEGFDSLEAVAETVAAYNPHRPRPKDISGLEKNLRRSEDGRYHWHWDPAFMASDPGASDEFVNEATLDDVPLPDRKGHWVQEFFKMPEVLTYLASQFEDVERVRQICKEMKTP